MNFLFSEREELFRGNLGVNSDVVIKEMFQLQDRSGESLALRPEGTMGVLRAVTEKHGCPMPVKVSFYISMFSCLLITFLQVTLLWTNVSL